MQAEDPLHGFHSGITGRIDPGELGFGYISFRFCLPSPLAQAVIGLLGCICCGVPDAHVCFCRQSPTRYTRGLIKASLPRHSTKSADRGHLLGAYQGEPTFNQREL